MTYTNRLLTKKAGLAIQKALAVLNEQMLFN